MSDFSIFSLFTAGLACLVPLTAAYTQPKGDAPKGNPISEPGLNSVVPVGKPFTITWQPTTKGTVTLVLLKGPSSNAVPQYPIVEKTDNNGSYVWTPSTSLAPSDGAQGYGIELIDDATGQYQYTTQFGISNPDYNPKSSSSSSAAKAPVYGSSTSLSPKEKTTAAAGPVYTTAFVTDYTTYCPYATTFGINNKTYTVTSATTLTIKDCSCTITKPLHTAAPIHTSAPGSFASSINAKPTVHPVANVTMTQPTSAAPVAASSSAYNAPAGTGSAVAPASNSSVPGVAQSTGGAAGLATSLISVVLAAGVAVFAL